MASDDEQHQQEQPPAASDQINIKVVDQDGAETFFKIKHHTKLGKLMAAYTQRSGKSAGTIRFMHEGQKITENDTPASLDLEDGDCIECHMEQVGGDRL